METMDRVCAQLGVPMAPHKREGPTTCLIFLGIEIDTVAGAGQLGVPGMAASVQRYF